MKLGILLSGGKDSLYAGYIAAQDHELACAISIQSENKESYMFHTPNINLVSLQAQAMQIPLILKNSQGMKEEELKDLHDAIKEAKEKHNIKGIVTGAVASQYQASRIQKICHELELWCFNPLWQINQVELLNQLIQHHFDVTIIGVFAYPLDESFLGAKITHQLIKKLVELEKEFKINPAGEGGETESLVLDCPLFKKKIKIIQSEKKYHNYAGIYTVINAELVDKKEQKKERVLFDFKEELENPDITIIDTTSKDILRYEFIRPITDILKEKNKTYKIINISELKNQELSDKIIISGTALKDNEFLKYENEETKLKGKKILGICAGAEILGLFAGAKLKDIYEIGQLFVKKQKEHYLFSKVKQEEFFLHQQGFSINDPALDVYLTSDKGVAGFSIPNTQWFGIQFHPEIREKSILERFIQD